MKQVKTLEITTSKSWFYLLTLGTSAMLLLIQQTMFRYCPMFPEEAVPHLTLPSRKMLTVFFSIPHNCLVYLFLNELFSQYTLHIHNTSLKSTKHDRLLNK